MASLSELIKQAEQGDSYVMIDLGVIYRWGTGVDRDMERCFYWTKRAAAMLNPIAYQYLGYHHEIPVGYSDINDDNAVYKTVFDCFFKGAVLDDPTSMYKVGDMYFTGKFVEKDQVFAYKLYKKSEKYLGSSSASLNLRLGECYTMGLGTEQDIKKASEYLEDAIYEYQEQIADGRDPELFMEGYNRAKHLLKRIEADKIPGKPINLMLEQSNETIALEEIGRYYLNGDVVEQDYERAYKCFVKCALFKETYDYSALSELAHMYREGIFVEADIAFSEYLEEQSKKQGESGKEYEQR